MNLFLLYITAQTLKTNIKIKNIIFSSAFGSAYAVISFCYDLKFLLYVPIKFLVAILMILICFMSKEVSFNIKASFMFILYAMVLGGLCIFIEFSKGPMINGNLNKFSYKILLCALMLLYVAIHRIVCRIIVYVNDRNKVTQLVYDVEIIDGKFGKKFKAFLDTGNELREPVTNLPVIIVEKNIFQDSKIEDKDKFLIPYRVVNGFSDSLEGFKPTAFRIYKDDEVEECQVIIALCKNKLSELNDYNALLSRGVF